MTAPLIRLEEVSVEYKGFKALDRASLQVEPGQIVGIVGESGSGKSTALNAMMGLAPISEGEVFFGEERITHLRTSQRRRVWRDMQMIFQDPSTSLSPSRSLAASVAEPLIAHGENAVAARSRAAALLELVGLDAAMADRSPHALSGGQRQRVAIARALALSPRLIVADEPMSALDVSVKAQIAALFSDLRSRLGTAFLIVSHDLALMSAIADRIIVMKRGRIVEQGPASAVVEAPTQAYTQRLRAACLDPQEVIRARFSDTEHAA
ncbi:MAG: dipeptide/oligopeptide/nickel ABC transporter ATP-binding protein [Brevundimonas sp.]|uniref:ABC transporter ATP-binding protein n=1 Tax=Brevundimonas sp. TaxID=1871086 RepID=UPI0027365E88|nr:dipeptide/oligopeptide/nickel ABC transporter ATP-binding protein [Brevundimonas sp.]MDP3378328.1 dipeptide/oligopeptide/nickel ABC transporter ATP-binding protein [Brevundimonas sp.]